MSDTKKDEHAEHIELDLNLKEFEPLSEKRNSSFRAFAAQDEEWKAQQTKKLLRKIDWHLMPFLITMYLLNFLDRSNLAQARQGSLEEDLDMKGTDFNLATSILFVGYLLMQLPSNVLITKVKPSIYLATAMCTWGVVSTCTAATHNFTGLVLVRFFLGFVEAPFFPGAIFLMSSWYTRAELTRRVAWFYSGSSLANMFGGLIAAGVLSNLDGAQGLAGWRWLFIIEGVITIGIAITSGFFLPDYPTTTRWLTEEERAFAAWRLTEDIKEADEPETSVWQGLRLAFKDYRIYFFLLLQHLSLLSQTFQYFFPSIVGTLGFGSIETLLLTVPVWFATFLASILVTWTSALSGDRSIHIIALMLIAVAGNAMATASTSTPVRFVAMFLMPVGAVSAYQIIVAWVANSFPRPLVKRSAAIAVCNMIGNTASIYGSYMYPSSAAPQYVPGGSANAVVSLAVVGLALMLRYIHLRENKKLEAGERGEGNEEEEGIGRRGEGFRYVY